MREGENRQERHALHLFRTKNLSLEEREKDASPFPFQYLKVGISVRLEGMQPIVFFKKWTTTGWSGGVRRIIIYYSPHFPRLRPIFRDLGLN
jgi:hypothetical protein